MLNLSGQINVPKKLAHSLPYTSGRSRDNLPNPEIGRDHIYIPQNRPAIGDLMNLFSFDQHDGHDGDHDHDDDHGHGDHG